MPLAAFQLHSLLATPYSLLPPKGIPTPMRAETEALTEAIKQSVGLLRRHL